ncbi:uncharacterized protein LOC113028708 [Astatotilapia calliptera]|uniref:uncharacterized protein LOC113028708 n=1 Tax=Astatotilapia calliptera TaxID=8154 RepID=UPI000E4172F6|nr:uncharacterized protein LOC113028708 [Astatotilapia calliptera]
MIVFWIALNLLHRGYALVSQITVQAGEPATFICSLPHTEVLPRQVHWYKQSAGDTLKVIVTVRKSKPPEYAQDFPKSRWETILGTIQEDEGMYHCGVSEWLADIIWTGMHLLIKGKNQSISNSSVAQSSTVSSGTKPDIHGSSIWSHRSGAVIFMLCAVLAISLIVIAILIAAMKKDDTQYCKGVVPLRKNTGIQKTQQKAEDVWFYSAAVFAMMGTDRGGTTDAAERERLHTAVKAFGLD